MSLVYAPERKHSCDIGWELVPWPVPDESAPWNPGPPPGITSQWEMVHRDDAPGTVRRCEDCGRCWRAEKNRPGMAGVFWRPERRLERWRRERAVRRGERAERGGYASGGQARV